MLRLFFGNGEKDKDAKGKGKAKDGKTKSKWEELGDEAVKAGGREYRIDQRGNVVSLNTKPEDLRYDD